MPERNLPHLRLEGGWQDHRYTYPGPPPRTTINELSPANSDLVVPVPSQRNSSGTGHPNELAGQEFPFTAHSAVPNVLPGETESTLIRVKVAELLSGWPSVYSPSWSIGP